MGCIAIDPGKVSGWAVFDEQKELMQASWGDSQQFKTACKLFFYTKPVIEIPIAYPSRKVDPNDLIKLAIMAGEYAGYLDALGFPQAQFVKPVQWKGTVPKDVHQRRILKKLKPEELERLPKRPRAKDYDHNMLDAVGIGLWKLGRL